jgi:pimeloyl-ACP methyl ester carboxylesterase
MLLNTLVSGEGLPIALLHGLFGRAKNLAHIARRLANTNRVISIDLRNHGASPHAADMDYPTLARDVLQTLAAMNALPTALLGHSMGGKAAMAAALLAPTQISRLLVADIAPVAYTHHNARIAAALLALPLTPNMRRNTADAALAEAVPDPGVRAFLLQNADFATGTWRIGLPEIAAAIADIENWPTLTVTYNGPTLFVRGARSDYIGQAEETVIRNHFPQARIETLPEAGHWLHADQPQAFADIAAAFLAA